MSKMRRYLAPLLTILLLIFTFSSVLFEKSKSSSEKKISQLSDSDKPKADKDVFASYEERVFEMQAKFTYGLVQFLKQHSGQSVPKEQAEELTKSVTMSFQEGLETVREQNAVAGRPQSKRFLLKQLILFESLGTETSKARLCAKEFSQAPVSAAEIAADNICRGVPDTALQDELLSKELGWFAQLHKSQSDPSVELDTAAFFIKTLIGLVIALAVGFFSTILFTFFMYRIVSKKAEFKFRAAKIDPHYAIEIFLLYMLLMNCLPLLLKLPELRAYLLPLNAIAISAQVFLVFWPCLFQESFSDVRQSLGLYLGGIKRFAADILFGVVAYVAAIVPILIIMLVYSLVLTALKVDVNSGTHPIVPILTETKKSSTAIWIVVLAVIVAPIVEEIMFRGALQCWLRDKVGVFVTLLIGAFIFAAIHPQGVVGIVPLTSIGFMLGLVREWRGNLTSSMVAHACVNGGTLLLAFNLLR